MRSPHSLRWATSALFLLFVGCSFLEGLKGGARPEDQTGTPYGCEGVEHCKEGNYDQAACEAYKACYEAGRKEAITAIVNGVEVPNHGAGTGSGEASETPSAGSGESCAPRKDCPEGSVCPSSPTCEHIFAPDDPPKYWYTVAKNGKCTKQMVTHCKICHTTYKGFAPTEPFTYAEIQQALREARARYDAAEKAYYALKSSLGDVCSPELFEAKMTMEWAKQYWDHIYAAQDDAELNGHCP